MMGSVSSSGGTRSGGDMGSTPAREATSKEPGKSHHKLGGRAWNEDAVTQVRLPQGILPICSYCKEVRDDQNYWMYLISRMPAMRER